MRRAPKEVEPREIPPIDITRIGGGATAGELVIPKSTAESKLTLSERLGSAFQKATKILDGHGVAADPKATPMVREYARQFTTIKNQGHLFASYGELLQRLLKVNSMTGISEDFGVTIPDLAWHFSKYKDQLTPEELQTFNTMRATVDSFTQQLWDSGVKFEILSGVTAQADPSRPVGEYLDPSASA